MLPQQLRTKQLYSILFLFLRTFNNSQNFTFSGKFCLPEKNVFTQTTLKCKYCEIDNCNSPKPWFVLNFASNWSFAWWLSISLQEFTSQFLGKKYNLMLCKEFVIFTADISLSKLSILKTFLICGIFSLSLVIRLSR